MTRKLVWYYIYIRIAKQMWSERKWWFKAPPMTTKRFDQILKDLYIKPIKEYINTLSLCDKSTYNDVWGTQ